MSGRKRPERELPLDTSGRGRLIDARLSLLDRQVLDVDGVPVTTVDDIELVDGRGSAAPRVEALLSGSILNTRLLGGDQPPSRWGRIPWSAVTEVGVVVSLGIRGEELDVTWTERWLRDHLIRRIPGGRHDPQ